VINNQQIDNQQIDKRQSQSTIVNRSNRQSAISNPQSI